MKALKGTVEMKLAAIFVFFAAALLVTTGASSRFNLGSIEPGISVAQAEDTVEPPVDNTIVNEAPVSGDMAQ